MQIDAQSRIKSGRVAPCNAFLLCTVLAKQTRRLGRLLPDRRIAELIAIAMRNCADYELALDLGPGVPEVVRTEAMQIGRLTRRLEPPLVSSLGPMEGSQVADAASPVQQDTGEPEPAGKGASLGQSANGSDISVGSAVDSFDSRSSLSSTQRTRSMSRSNGIDPTRIRQLRAIADNLCTLANRHRENHNHVVAHALYGRALAVAQEIHTPEDDGKALTARIRKDQETVFEMMRAGESRERPPLDKAKEVGQ
jgi:hypothetical protein